MFVSLTVGTTVHPTAMDSGVEREEFTDIITDITEEKNYFKGFCKIKVRDKEWGFAKLVNIQNDFLSQGLKSWSHLRPVRKKRKKIAFWSFQECQMQNVTNFFFSF